MNAKIREMRKEDIPSIIILEKELFSTAWEEEMFLEEIEKQYAYVLQEENEIIGYVCGWKILDEFNITNIAIASDFQRQGFGELLVRFIISKLLKDECYKFYLEVRESNNKAQRLYEKIGFSVIGSRKKYYHTPEEDAQILGLNYTNI